MFDRAEARDFVDVYVLADRYSKELLLKRTGEVDPGFNHAIYADMVRTLNRFTDGDLPITPEFVGSLRDFFTQWDSEIRTQTDHS